MTTKADTGSNLLTFEELTSFDMGQVIRLEAPEIPKNGAPGVLLIKPLSAEDVISLIEFNEKNKDNEVVQRQYMFTLIAQSLVNEKGDKMITSELQLKALMGIPASLYRRLVTAVTKASGAGDKTADAAVEAGKRLEGSAWLVFAYDLAKELGIWDVRGMLQRMSWSQFAEWAAYYKRNPFGETRADLRAGIVASVIANVNRDPKKKPKALSAEDFMPKYGPSARKVDGPREPMMEDGWKRFESMALAVYGSGKRPNHEEE